jgi:glucosamine--fructose-6-phosphate aminotransferase (isomerizing)
MYEKTLSNLQVVKARHGPIIAVATEGDAQIASQADDVIYLPATIEPLFPLLAVIPLQLLAYHIAVVRGCDVDKPRNLAKSVTVE